MDEERKEVLKDYKKLEKKFGLEDLEKLENEFSFYIYEKGLYLDIISKAIMKRISEIRGFLYPQIEPNTSITKYESKFLKEKDKERILKIVKEMIYYEWRLFEARLKGDDARAQFIKDSIDFFRNKLKPFSLEIGSKIMDSWKKDIHEKKSNSKKHNTYIS